MPSCSSCRGSAKARALRKSTRQRSQFQRALAGGETHLFRVALDAGQYVRVVVEQQGSDVAVALVAPNKDRLLEVDSPNGDRGPEPVSAIVGQSGEYLIEVRSPDKSAPVGAYEIRLDAQRAPFARRTASPTDGRGASRVAGKV